MKQKTHNPLKLILQQPGKMPRAKDFSVTPQPQPKKLVSVTTSKPPRRKRVEYTKKFHKQQVNKFFKLAVVFITLSFIGGCVATGMLLGMWNASQGWRAYHNGVRAATPSQSLYVNP